MCSHNDSNQLVTLAKMLTSTLEHHRTVPVEFVYLYQNSIKEERYKALEIIGKEENEGSFFGVKSCLEILSKFDSSFLKSVKRDLEEAKDIESLSNIKKQVLTMSNDSNVVLRNISRDNISLILRDRLLQYEIVHEFENEDELVNYRLAKNRECFALFRPNALDDPLIHIWVAVMDSIPFSIHQIIPATEKNSNGVSRVLLQNNPCITPTTAVFYSINNNLMFCSNPLMGAGRDLILDSVKLIKAKYPSKLNYTLLKDFYMKTLLIIGK